MRIKTQGKYSKGYTKQFFIDENPELKISANIYFDKRLGAGKNCNDSFIVTEKIKNLPAIRTIGNVIMLVMDEFEIY